MIQNLDFKVFISTLIYFGIIEGGNSEQQDGLKFLMNRFQADPRITSSPRPVELTSYILASIGHECCKPVNTLEGKTKYIRTFQPIREFGGAAYFEKNYGLRKDLGNINPGDGARYHGRGYVQNTGRRNAELTGQRLAGMPLEESDLARADSLIVAAFDREVSKAGRFVLVDDQLFVREPELLLIPRVSYADMMSGLFEGRYTNKKITAYINEGAVDYLNARRTINGDVAKNGGKIAELAMKIETAIRKVIAVAPTNIISLLDVDPPSPAPVAAKSGRVKSPTIGVDPAKPSEDKTAVVVVEPSPSPADQIVEVAHQIKSLRPGWISALGAATFAFFQNNPYFFWGAVTIVVALVFVAGYIYVQRMKLAADPTQYTPK